MMRVLVTGGRGFGEVPNDTPPECWREAQAKADKERALVFDTLDMLHVDHGITCVIHGAAKGADRAAERV